MAYALLSPYQSAAAVAAAAPPPQQVRPNQTEVEKKILQITQFNIQTYMTKPGTYYFRKSTNTTAVLYVIVFMTNDKKIGKYKFTFTNDDKIQMEPLERVIPPNYKYTTHNNIDELLTFVKTKNNIDEMKYIIEVKEESQAADATPTNVKSSAPSQNTHTQFTNSGHASAITHRDNPEIFAPLPAVAVAAASHNVQPSAPSEIDICINNAIKFMEELQNGTNPPNGNHVGVFKTKDAEKVNTVLYDIQYGSYIYYYFTYEEAGPLKKIGSFFGSNSNYKKIYSWRLIIVDYRNIKTIMKDEIEITPCKINGEFCMCIKDVMSLPAFMRKPLDNFIKTLPPDVIKKISKIPVADFIKRLQPIRTLPNIQLKGGKAKKTRARRSNKSKRNTRRNTKRHRK